MFSSSKLSFSRLNNKLNLSCKQKSSRFYSFSALKYTDGPYVINGNWKLVHSKAYKAAGATFRYKRPSPNDYNSAREHIIAKGPTNQSLEIMVGVIVNVRNVYNSFVFWLRAKIPQRFFEVFFWKLSILSNKLETDTTM